MAHSKKFIVDRGSYIAWAQGILLERDSVGRCSVGDSVQHEQADKILEDGGIVYLAVGGEIVSFIQDTGDSYEEQLLDDCSE